MSLPTTSRTTWSKISRTRTLAMLRRALPVVPWSALSSAALVILIMGFMRSRMKPMIDPSGGRKRCLFAVLMQSAANSRLLESMVLAQILGASAQPVFMDFLLSLSPAYCSCAHFISPCASCFSRFFFTRLFTHHTSQFTD